MAFPLDYGELYSERVPVPAPPRIARASRRRVFQRVTVAGLLWLVGGVTAGFVTPFDGEPPRFVVSVVALCLCVAYAPIVLAGTGKDMARALGHGRRGWWGGDVARLAGPPGTVATCLAAVFGGLGLGLVAAVGIRVALGDPTTIALGALAVDAPLFVWAFARARRAWRCPEHAEQQRILAHGVHVVARVGSIRPQGQWIDDMAVFLVELDFEYRGEPVVRQLYLPDHPVWAPVEGNEFDLWIDAADPGRVVVERRYVGQRFADRPERFRRPEIADTEEGALAPGWVADMGAGYRLRTRTAVVPSLGALVALAAAWVVPAAVEVPWWTGAALVVHGVLGVVNAVVAWRFVVLGRRFVRQGRTFYGTRARACCGVVTAFLGTFFAPGMVLYPLIGDAPWTVGHGAAAAAVLSGLLLVSWSAGLDGLAREINEGAPVELVQEVLTGHNDRRIDELERDHGFAVSVLLLPS
ncbi:hypothetical protein [Actinophytocola sp. NPDC049390]|uniref:hypothetical protein n=1 Tax=Actinophytocola sp. NPDC049390 TaxID=3363894 RepID=UPI0037BC6B99